jgi:S-DNA-T family DNA segregation ATPase FtsK/SpoIIIE
MKTSVYQRIKNILAWITNFDPRLELSKYKFPSIDLLEEHGSGQIEINKEELEQNKNQIVQTLLNYNIGIEKIKATVGPTVTLYEIVPEKRCPDF